MVFERVPYDAFKKCNGIEPTLAETLTIVARRIRRQHRAVVRDGEQVLSERIICNYEAKFFHVGSNFEILRF